jgi:glycosyltransferase involved in cell wall biosynthesis
MPKLILFTSSFPYGYGETFLETEIRYLAEAFNEVLIISNDSGYSTQREIPKNCKSIYYPYELKSWEKVLALFFFFHPLFWKELSIIKNTYRQSLTRGKLATMLIALYRAYQVKSFCKSLIPLHKDGKETIFYSYWGSDIAFGLALLQKENPELTCISRVHRWDVYFEESEFGYLSFRHFISDNLKHIFAISEDARRYALECWKMNNPAKISVARLGINNNHPFLPHHSEIFTLVSCSNIIPVKRLTLLATALQSVSGQRIRWIHFGEGSGRKDLENMIARLPDNITVQLKGRVSNTDIYSFYHNHCPDLFINISSSEGIPVAIMEAMSFGIPVIATDAGGNREIVNGQNGILLPVDVSNEKLAETIKAFIALSKEKKEEKQHAARSTWKLKFNAETNYREFTSLIQRL